jgi:hypothetical protein
VYYEIDCGCGQQAIGPWSGPLSSFEFSSTSKRRKATFRFSFSHRRGYAFIEPTLDIIMDPNQDGPEPCSLHKSSPEQSTVTTLANLPHEVIFKILSYLPAESLSAVSQTCRHLNSASFADLLWQRLCEPYSIPTHSPFPCWRDFYTLRLHNWGFLLGIWCSDRKPRGIMILSLISMLNCR